MAGSESDPTCILVVKNGKRSSERRARGNEHFVPFQIRSRVSEHKGGLAYPSPAAARSTRGCKLSRLLMEDYMNPLAVRCGKRQPRKVKEGSTADSHWYQESRDAKTGAIWGSSGPGS